ncbi:MULTISPECIES: hypothetical protein [Streptomyces]|uniref:Uncharacterized protein n=1 Tax=Streptomyces luteosporeus TaxID=173856 RepID=A0ABP6GCC9_9ACTN
MTDQHTTEIRRPADVPAGENPDGSAEAVARVLCTEDECAAIAERYRRDAEAEAARKWAANKLQHQDVQLLKLRCELEKSTPGRTATDMLAALLAVQQERNGGETDRVVLWLDEAAPLFREAGLFRDRSPGGVRRELDRLIRQNRAPYPAASDDDVAPLVEETGNSPRLDLEQALSMPNWADPARGSMTPTLSAEGRAHLGPPNT